VAPNISSLVLVCAEKDSDDAAAGLAVRLGNWGNLLEVSGIFSDLGGG